MSQAPMMFMQQPNATPPSPVEDHEALLFARVEELAPLNEPSTYVMIWRANAGSPRVYVGRLMLDEFTHEAIQQKWGGGRYCCQIKRGKAFDKCATFNVDGGPATAPAPQLQATPVAPPRPASGDPMVDMLREQLAQQTNLVTQLLLQRSAPASSDRDLLLALLQQNSGPGQFAKAVELVTQLQAMGAGAQQAGGGLEGMLEALATKVIERMDRAPSRRLAQGPAQPAPQAAPPSPPPARAEATPVASSKASPIWPAAMLAAEEKLGIPLRALATDLEHAAISGMDADTAGIVLYRRLTHGRKLTPADAAFFEQFDEEIAAANLIEWVPSLAPHRDMVLQAIENMVGLVLGELSPEKEGEA